MKLKEDSFVYVKDKGLVKICDVNVNDFVLCFGSESDEYTKITHKTIFNEFQYNHLYMSNGSVLNCISDPFPSIFSTPSKKLDIYNFDKSLSKVGWFLGMHTGDGTSDRHYMKTKKPYYKYRLRILGDNENCIKEYCDFVNNYTNTMNNYKLSKSKITWEYCSSNKNNSQLIENLFDSKYGNKVFCGDVYSFVEKHNLWIPYLSGLIDSDGYIKPPGHPRIDMCMTKVVDKLACMLSYSGISYFRAYTTKVDENESPIHTLYIFSREYVCGQLALYMNHLKKKQNLENRTDTAKSKFLYSLDDKFLESIDSRKCIEKYSKQILFDCKKYKMIGLGGLTNMLKCGMITEQEYIRICRQVTKKSETILMDNVNMIELKTDSGNFYAGNFGLVNVTC